VRNWKEAVCVASLTEVKNHAGLIEAWTEVVSAHPTATLTLVGDGPLREALEAQVRDGGIESNVKFVGLQSDVRPYLHRAGLFVLPSFREAMPLSLLEAMATGIPAVASEVGAVPEIVRQGMTGRLVPPGEPAPLAKALIELLADPGSLKKQGLRAREEVSREFSLRARVDAIEEGYQVAIRSRQGS